MHLNWPCPFLLFPFQHSITRIFFLAEDHCLLYVFFSFLSIDGKSNFTSGKLIISSRSRTIEFLSRYSSCWKFLIHCERESYDWRSFRLFWGDATRDNRRIIDIFSKIYWTIKFHCTIFWKTTELLFSTWNNLWITDKRLRIEAQRKHDEKN